ncbi:hypothetical protein pdul_cds_329 [Pandoravirus dulcis]|uniref:Uncharacterized protein n=1 Tax=Pandoravirus dulcis TaxID=1349409 RepID=S4VWN2_9VIRU|nr:hypothetical protein pdul_cds_329 [Pandoravirus dulcis]AGO82339.1 hypothetical protein pdul_cds_329 [Pandoravirus dulcis]
MASSHTNAPPCCDDHDGSHRERDDTSPVLGAAIDLLSRARLDRIAHRISAHIGLIACDHAGVRRVVLGDDVLYDGPGVPAEAIDTKAIADRVVFTCRGDDCDHAPLLFVNDRQVHPHVWDIWNGDRPLGEELLARSLAGDDVAHCAMEIAALMGDTFWRSFADTSTNFRTGRATPSVCPAWLVDATLASDGCNSVLTACDAAILYDIVRTLENEASIGRRAELDRRVVLTTNSALDALGPGPRPATRVTSTAVGITPGFWVFGGTGGVAAATGARLMTTRQMSSELARVRALGSTMGVLVDVGNRIHSISESCVALSETLRGASVSPGGASRRNALADIIAFADAFTRECLGSVLAVVAASGIDDDDTNDRRRDLLNSGRVHSLTLSGARVTSAQETVCDLGHRLRAADEARLRARLRPLLSGKPFPRARIYAYTYADGVFLGQRHYDDGLWRDSCGRVVFWSSLVRRILATRSEAYHQQDYALRGGQTQECRTAHIDPACAPDWTFALCRDALAGDPRATDWLAVLSMASLAWRALAVTVRNVVRWNESGCPVDAAIEGTSGRDRSMVDWMLDVPPHQDLAVRFGDAQDAFNARLLDAIRADGGRIPPPTPSAIDNEHAIGPRCACPSGVATTWHDTVENSYCCLCLFRTLAYVRVSYEDGARGWCYRPTYRGALIEALTCTPLATDGRQILATETACHLAGDEADGIRALVRALYTVDSLRTSVIHRAQAAMVPVLTDALS